MIQHLLFALLSIGLLHPSDAQSIIEASFASEAWSIEANKHEFTTYQGKRCLYMEGGKARLKGAQFLNGIIDFKVNFSEGRKFAGVQFRSQDLSNYEEFYLRAHQSGNPDATQYTPVYNGLAGWQLYYGTGYGAPVKHRFDEWVPVRLIVSGNEMEVYIGDMETPALQVPELKREAQYGGIGFWAFLGGAYFADLQYQDLQAASFSSPIPPLPDADAGVIRDWLVSPVFDGNSTKAVSDLTQLPQFEQLSWQKLRTENSGLLNLAQVAPLTNTQNTVWVRTQIEATQSALRRLVFGYSDKARVFIDGKLVYGGQHSYRSRDYRYLGTIGYFDELYVHLAPGTHEVVFAITEDFGGWGLIAKWEKM